MKSSIQESEVSRQNKRADQHILHEPKIVTVLHPDF